MIKSSYVSIGKQGLAGMRRHLAYLERDSVDRDGSPGRLYGAEEGFDRDAFRAPLDDEQRQFRFIVSPEDGDTCAGGRRKLSRASLGPGRT